MTRIVTEGDGFGKSDIESQNTSNRNCYLRNFECVCKTCALVVVGKNEHLCFARKAAEG